MDKRSSYQKISDVMYNVKINCSNFIVQKHVDQLRYMPLIDYFYEENDKHELKSQLKLMNNTISTTNIN